MLEKTNSLLIENINQVIEAQMWKSFSSSDRQHNYANFKLDYQKNRSLIAIEIDIAFSFLKNYLLTSESGLESQIKDCVEFIVGKIDTFHKSTRSEHPNQFDNLITDLLSSPLYSPLPISKLSLLIPFCDILGTKKISSLYEILSAGIKRQNKQGLGTAIDSPPEFIINKISFFNEYLISKSDLIPRLGEISELNLALLNYVKGALSKEQLFQSATKNSSLIKSLCIYQKHVRNKANNLAEFEAMAKEIGIFSSTSRTVFSSIENIIMFSEIFTDYSEKNKHKKLNTPFFNFTDLFKNQPSTLKEIIEKGSIEEIYSLLNHFKSSPQYDVDCFAIFKSLLSIESKPDSIITNPLNRHPLKELFPLLKLDRDSFSKAIVMFYAMGPDILKNKFLSFEKANFSNIDFKLELSASNVGEITLNMLNLIKSAVPLDRISSINYKNQKEMIESFKILLERKILDYTIVSDSSDNEPGNTKKFKV